MIVYNGYANLNINSPVVTMGIFDGVHRGHKALLEYLVMRADQTGGESVAITFFPHPRLVLDKKPEGLSYLTTMDEKRELLEKAGIKNLIIINFNTDFSRLTACEFVNNVLHKKLGTRNLIVGFNHHFGNRGEGDFETITSCAKPLGIIVEQMKGLHSEEGAISSSAIREALLSGRLDEANKWLGYNYMISGEVIEGRQIGRKIGFPTANIKPDDPYKLIPCSGVYAVEVKIDGVIFHGMLNIGTNPTVNDDNSKRSIEVYILDFNKDIYGQKISVNFIKRIRDEVKFENLDQLSMQMEQDKSDTRRILS